MSNEQVRSVVKFVLTEQVVRSDEGMYVGWVGTSTTGESLTCPCLVYHHHHRFNVRSRRKAIIHYAPAFRAVSASASTVSDFGCQKYGVEQGFLRPDAFPDAKEFFVGGKPNTGCSLKSHPGPVLE